MAKIAALLLEYGAKIHTQTNLGIQPFEDVSMPLIRNVYDILLERFSNVPTKHLKNIEYGLSSLDAMIRKDDNPDLSRGFTLDSEGNMVCIGINNEDTTKSEPHT